MIGTQSVLYGNYGHVCILMAFFQGYSFLYSIFVHEEMNLSLRFKLLFLLLTPSKSLSEDQTKQKGHEGKPREKGSVVIVMRIDQR
jgi:hypothetical protein